jgi:TonB family protein
MRTFKFLTIAVAMFAAFPAYADYVKPRVDPSQPNPGPVYPAAAEAAGEEGTVVLQLHISPSGKVRRFKVKQSSGFADLDSAAITTALNWHYLPAAMNGYTRTDDMDLAIQFKLPPAPH